MNDLKDAPLVYLINLLAGDASFRDEFLAEADGSYHQRNVIKRALNRHGYDGRTIEERETLQHEFQAIFGFGDYKTQATSTQTINKENSMNNITITSITYVNGTDVKHLTDDQIFQTIANAEAEIKRLDAIENKPKKLQAKIDDLKANIKALADLVDSRD